jgi:7-carboxy-7-deazaguanine synthase
MESSRSGARVPAPRSDAKAPDAVAPDALSPEERSAPRRGSSDATRTSAPILEVFASIQGEGAFVGEPQAFLRVRGCPLRCRWCDTPGSWTLPESPRARIASARGTRHEPAWATPFQAACWIAEVEPGEPRTVSVTGGEPLLWPEFVLALKGMLGARRLHLETAGAHPRALARVIGACDHVSLDLKPDRDLDAPVELEAELGVDPGRIAPERAPRNAAEWKSAREECLRLVGGRDACGKIVVSGLRVAEDFAPLLDEVERIAPSLLVIVQPSTAVRDVPAPSLDLVLQVAEMARDRDLAVRVVPQMHRHLGLP